MIGEFEFLQTSIMGLISITPFYAPDNRGYLSKPFEKNIFASHGVALSPWEELRSCSHKGVLRGLHFQRRHSQDKLVQVLHGAVYDYMMWRWICARARRPLANGRDFT